MKYLAAFVIGVRLFAQSAHAIEFYWVLFKSTNFLIPLSVTQWSYKLNDNEKACEQTLIKEAMKLDGFLVERKRTGVWAFTSGTVGNTYVPVENLMCTEVRIDPEGTRDGYYD